MQRNELEQAQAWLRSELKTCIDFWLTHGMDTVHGGVYTCLDREGNVYSTDKSVWMQGRCAWMFAALCKQYGARPEWLAAAKSCLDFMEAHCINRAAGGRMYFQVTAEGKPLRQRRYCFSEAFYVLANAEYYGLTGESIYLERARTAYHLVHGLNTGTLPDPAGLGPKGIVETRAGRTLADPMIFLNITSALWQADPAHRAEYDSHAAQCAETILQYHFKPELNCTLENVGLQGEFWADVTAGRMVNPGHDMECSWFLMEYANRLGGEEGRTVHTHAQTILRNAMAAGWDETYGGLLYFTDCLGKPPEAYEHDMKLWWPHNETLIATLMAYRDTGEPQYADWFFKTLAYCKTYFSDPAHGEWYGYLRRDGKPTQPSTKGSTFKGPFHLPRSLAFCDMLLAQLLEQPAPSL